MKVIKNPRSIQRLADSLRGQGKTIGFVPTMGALHEGHISLISTARRENDIVLASLFVNPAQFGPKEDFQRYPRPFAKDRRMMQEHEVDYLFYPSSGDIYPEGFATFVEVVGHGGAPSMSGLLCGKSRPGHFRGVATVVTKLFNLIRPHRAYFGAKDYQQSVIIKRLIADLDMPIHLRVLPTVREKDGLAMSSRNRYLNPSQRKRARVIANTLFWLRDQLISGGRNLSALRRRARMRLAREVDHVDYLEIVHPASLISLKRPEPVMVAVTACYVGKTRLIDNVIIRLP